MLERIDSYIARLWHIPLVFLCKASGKSNFFWARMIALVSLACIITGTLLSLSFITLGVCIYVSYFVIRAIVLLEKHGRDSQSSDSIHLPLSTKIIAIRPIISGYACLITPILMTSGTFGRFTLYHVICTIGTLYWSTDIQRPSKSWARRAVDWLKAHRPQFAPAHPPAFPIPG